MSSSYTIDGQNSLSYCIIDVVLYVFVTNVLIQGASFLSYYSILVHLNILLSSFS